MAFALYFIQQVPMESFPVVVMCTGGRTTLSPKANSHVVDEEPTEAPETN